MTPIIKFLSSTSITVVCLFILFILTFWGTVAQVQHGLYGAQERFFNSFFFLAAGFIPFPGAQLVLWVLFVNLVCMFVLSIRRFLIISNLGNLIIHVGILLYFVAAFMVFQLSRESNIHLSEGQATNVSAAYDDWEVAYWVDGEKDKRQVTAIDAKSLKPNEIVPLVNKDFTLSLKKFYSHCEAFGDNSGKKNPKILNASGITMLTPMPIEKEREKNVAGGVFNIQYLDRSYTLILFGNESKATSIEVNGKTHSFILRTKRFPLPFTLRLDDFKAEFYPGTEMAKNYESLVTITTGEIERQVRIYMNNPFRYRDYAVYQASYSIDNSGKEYSTLAVVKNSAWVLPYVACLVVFLGLALHFLMQAFTSRRKI